MSANIILVRPIVACLAPRHSTTPEGRRRVRAQDARAADVESCEAALRESENDAFAATFGGSGGDPALASAAAVARRYALRAARAELEAAKAAAAVTELRRDLAEALAREATLRAAHAGAS